MKYIYFLSFLLVLAGCKDLSEPPDVTVGEECKPKAGLAPPCGETSATRSVNLDCIHPQNDSVYWAIVEVYYDYEEGMHIDDIAEFIYQNGKILYQRNVACPDNCDPEECFKEFYSKPVASFSSLYDNAYFSYDGRYGNGKEDGRLRCSPALPYTFRFALVSDKNQTKILSREEFLNFIGEIDSYSEAIIRWAFPMFGAYVEDPLNREYDEYDVIKEYDLLNGIEESEDYYSISYSSIRDYRYQEYGYDSCSTRYYETKIKIAKSTQEIEVEYDTIRNEEFRWCNTCD